MVEMRFAAFPDGGKIPVLGMGTWRIGGNSSPDPSQDTKHLRALRAAVEMGYRHFDTAEMYAGGHAEELLGQALRGQPREEFFIASKVWPSHLAYRDVLRALDNSLKRLGTEYLDLYLIHWPNPQISLMETFRALNEAVRSGQVRRLGASNFDLNLLKEAQARSETPLANNQVPYSLFNREYADNGVLGYCQENGIVLTAYTPVEKGRVAKNRLIRQIAKAHMATPAQVALSWLISQPQVITIPMSTNPDHLRENLEAVELRLSDEEFQRLNYLK